MVRAISRHVDRHAALHDSTLRHYRRYRFLVIFCTVVFGANALLQFAYIGALRGWW